MRAPVWVVRCTRRGRRWYLNGFSDGGAFWVSSQVEAQRTYIRELASMAACLAGGTARVVRLVRRKGAGR